MSNPYQTPQSPLLHNTTSNTALLRFKKYVILDPDAAWPARCLKCNAPTDFTKKMRLSYFTPWIYLSLLISILITLLLVVILQKRFHLNLPLCETHRARHRYIAIAQWSLLAVVAGAVIAGIAYETPGLIFAALALFTALVISTLMNRVAFIGKYKEGKLWIKGAGRAFLESLQETP